MRILLIVLLVLACVVGAALRIAAGPWRVEGGDGPRVTFRWGLRRRR